MRKSAKPFTTELLSIETIKNKLRTMINHERYQGKESDISTMLTAFDHKTVEEFNGFFNHILESVKTANYKTTISPNWGDCCFIVPFTIFIPGIQPKPMNNNLPNLNGFPTDNSPSTQLKYDIVDSKFMTIIENHNKRNVGLSCNAYRRHMVDLKTVNQSIGFL